MRRWTAQAKWRAFSQAYKALLLVTASKAQTKAFNNLIKDIMLQPGLNEDDEDAISVGTPNSLDLTAAINRLLYSSNGQVPVRTPQHLSPSRTTIFYTAWPRRCCPIPKSLTTLRWKLPIWLTTFWPANCHKTRLRREARSIHRQQIVNVLPQLWWTKKFGT